MNHIFTFWVIKKRSILINNHIWLKILSQPYLTGSQPRSSTEAPKRSRAYDRVHPIPAEISFGVALYSVTQFQGRNGNYPGYHGTRGSSTNLARWQRIWCHPSIHQSWNNRLLSQRVPFWRHRLLTVKNNKRTMVVSLLCSPFEDWQRSRQIRRLYPLSSQYFCFTRHQLERIANNDKRASRQIWSFWHLKSLACHAEWHPTIITSEKNWTTFTQRCHPTVT